MIDFSKIQDEDFEEIEEEMVETFIDDFYRIALPSCKPEANPSWRKLSLCLVYPSVDFFDGSQQNKRRCRLICAECTVREQCLQFSLDNEEEFGVWGGLDDRERKQLMGKFTRTRAPRRKQHQFV